MKLLPPKNVRNTTPRACGTCKDFAHKGDGESECVRPDGPRFDTGDGWFLFMVCDRWASEEKSSKDKETQSTMAL